jgi:hypothetical protein
MVSAFIFALHFLAAVYIFLRYKKTSLSDALLAVAFVGIIFAVGWTIATMLINLLFSIRWFTDWYWQPLESHTWWIIRKELNPDTLSLLLLTSGEIVFYRFYFHAEKKKEKTPLNRQGNRSV